MTEFSLTIEDVMKKKIFDCAKLIGGAKGQVTTIKWVHIIEHMDAVKLLKGNELILTTGIHLKNHQQVFVNFIEQLIESKAAGLCIELGSSVQEIPDQVKQIANDAHFPLIIFEREVAFVEITQEIHSVLINQQYEMVKNLEDYAQQINKYTLTASNYEQILMHLYKHLKLQVIFTFNGQKPIFIPNLHQEKYDTLLSQVNDQLVEKQFIRCEVNILNQYYGEVCLLSSQRAITEYDTLILDRTVIALSQYLLRDLYIEEKKGMENREILEAWLNGTAHYEELKQFIQEQHPRITTSNWVVILHQIQDRPKGDVTYYKLYTRNVFEKLGFFPFLIEKNHQLIFILADLREQESYKQRIQQAIEQIHDNNKKIKYSNLDILFAVGKYVPTLQEVHHSFATAKDTLQIRLKSHALPYFYEDLYLHHIVFQLHKSPFLMDMVADKLHPLIDYDQKHHSHLVETLKIYLKSNGLKKEAADRLFIVRQTLYHRLDKIEQLLGEDFMQPEKRLLLELMLFASEWSFADSK